MRPADGSFWTPRTAVLGGGFRLVRSLAFLRLERVYRPRIRLKNAVLGKKVSTKLFSKDRFGRIVRRSHRIESS